MRKYTKMIAMMVLALFMFTSNGFAKDMLQIKGSDTLINLVQKLSEVYMEEYSGKYIAVTGGGSGTGIAALMNGKCDIANASRDIKAKEITQAEARGITPKRVVVAIDGLSVIVNEDNPVDRLTVEQLGKMFRGEIKNWSEVGGDNAPVTLYGRQSNSGTFSFFMEEVLKGDYSANMKRMNGNSQIVEAIKADRTGIGYVGVGYVKKAEGITVLKVAKNASFPYASPLDEADVKSGKYPISRPLNQYINGTPKGDVLDFIKFELSPEGQAIVEEEGFFMLPKEYQDYNVKQLGS
ncbi:MAG: PstS family phosphate ABC transporter substrate-binding protein [Candidatus Omnitrophica bacterium]|nr:PstS family phosphate ABC transporter substrate-binding protein [Candidatus Omnitrophota bacterium]MDD5488615.1 PstS family phosphate ABC transporter substrate-binding protein [Candidatus Omnitrophota bacterium]